MATPLKLRPLASSTPLSHLSGVSLSYSEQIHPALNTKASDHMQSHRQRIVKEMFDTEHTYISQLNTVVSLFLKPIKVGCLLPPSIISLIFSNIEAILSVNKELFCCMRQQSLGEAFTYLAPFLKLYSTYASNFQTSTHTLQEWLKHSLDFASFVASQESRPECCGLALSSLLIIPIQRVPRYKLLLEEILKYTKRTHPDFERLSNAAVQIGEVTSHINEYIRQHEIFKKMLSIQNSLTGNCVPSILAPGRKFIQEGRLMKVCRKKAKERMVYLFSDILIYARPNLLEKRENCDRTYEFRCVLPLLNSTIHILHSDYRAPEIEILLQISNEDTALTFFSSKTEDILQWNETIKDAIMKLKAAYGSLMTSQKISNPDRIDHLTPKSHNSGDTTGLTTVCTTLCTPYPLTATIFSTDFYQDPRSAKIFNYEPDVVNAVMNGSEGSSISHTKRTSCDETSNRQGHSKQSTNKENTHHKISSTLPTHEHASDGTESLLAQCSGLAQVASSGTVSSVHSVGSRYSRCCGVM